MIAATVHGRGGPRCAQIGDDLDMSTLARASLLAIALAICAWFALGFVQARDTGQATALVTGTAPLSTKNAARARSLLESAGTLNPDRTVDIVLGVLEVDQHRYAAAEQTLLSVTRREPMNAGAWVQLAFAAARNGDEKTAIIAGRTVGKLHPKLT
jgi:Flp pilus assembly protein TadD